MRILSSAIGEFGEPWAQLYPTPLPFTAGGGKWETSGQPWKQKEESRGLVWEPGGSLRPLRPWLPPYWLKRKFWKSCMVNCLPVLAKLWLLFSLVSVDCPRRQILVYFNYALAGSVLNCPHPKPFLLVVLLPFTAAGRQIFMTPVHHLQKSENLKVDRDPGKSRISWEMRIFQSGLQNICV